MIKIHENWWPASRKSTLLAYCVCPHCNSDNCSYSPEDGSWRCWHCGRDDRGQICREHPYDCPECGWHVMVWDRDDSHPWRCRRCRAGYKGDRETGPVGEPSYPAPCPVCGDRAVYGYVHERKPYGQYMDYYRCECCDTRFRADRYGRMIDPEPCAACGRVAVQPFDYIQYVGRSPNRERIVTKIKTCAKCGQSYDLELRPLDNNLNIIVPDEPDDDEATYVTLEQSDEYITVETKQE